MKLADLKNEGTDRAKINKWLDHINEKDQACRDEVLDKCKVDREARAYYVNRYIEDCAS